MSASRRRAGSRVCGSSCPRRRSATRPSSCRSASCSVRSTASLKALPRFRNDEPVERARAAARTRAGAEPAQIALETDPNLLQLPPPAGHGHHVGAQPRIRSRKGALDLTRRRRPLPVGVPERVRDAHALTGAANIREILCRASAGAGAVHAPFVPGKAFAREDAAGFLQSHARGRAGQVAAIPEASALELGPEPVHDEAEAAAGLALILGAPPALEGAEGRRPGKRQDVVVERAGRAGAELAKALPGRARGSDSRRGEKRAERSPHRNRP